MTLRVTLTPRAESDLQDIWDYSVAEWSVEQAALYAGQLRQHMALIAEHPRIGTAFVANRIAYRKFPSGLHILFYRIIDDGIDIVRILHQRMDFQRHL
jgi:toxin ParE1/3/4